ncbi:unnamed protein product [Didymodactylos carnosus]|uniref:Glycosyl transferase family 25 domain-containing protein n=1 Tax=Didymodactylos carnosus TaxID=1234261 RepID=A0A814YKD3_9BILA|nr:unnamed protein product [Didymodactylos carnosus]CAF1232001.1 unnamed protein product [Didymodactylos carnosus]CAF3652153.1 unnamed protein product [Didymodactylos carnosus]CAF3994611.1 unnamed protein product [Didymodactylos carnosus]
MLTSTWKIQNGLNKQRPLAILLGFLCLGLFFFFIAAAVVLSLIPIYLESKAVPATLTARTIEMELNYPIYNSSLATARAARISRRSIVPKYGPVDQTSFPAINKMVQRDIYQYTSIKVSLTVKVHQASLLNGSIATLQIFASFVFPVECGRQCQNATLVTLTSSTVVFANLESLQISIENVLIDLFLQQLSFAYFVLASTTVAITPDYFTGTTTYSNPLYYYTSTGAAIAPGRRKRNVVTTTPNIANSIMPVKGILMINLDINQEKYRLIKLHLNNNFTFVKYLPNKIERISAIHGHHINLHKSLEQGKLTKSVYNQIVQQDQVVGGEYMTYGALGCLESHVIAWKRVVKLQSPMLILEDDVVLRTPEFDRWWPYLLWSLPTDFDLLYFGNMIGPAVSPALKEYNELLWKMTGKHWGTYAYLISPKAAQILLNNIYPTQYQVDSMIIQIAQKQLLNVFMSKQSLVQIENRRQRPSKVQRFLISPIIIPKTIHFIWLANNESTSLPTAYQHNVNQWRKFHPNWEIKVWTEEDIAAILFPLYNQHLYDQARNRKQLSDIIRYELIFKHGGIYADLDFEPLRSIEPLLHGLKAFVAYESSKFICNGIFGSTPRHEFLKNIIQDLDHNWSVYKNSTVNQQTGPHFMTRQMKKQQSATILNGFQIFSTHIFFPFSWFEQDPGHPYDSTSYAVHHFRQLQSSRNTTLTV